MNPHEDDRQKTVAIRSSISTWTVATLITVVFSTMSYPPQTKAIGIALGVTGMVIAIISGPSLFKEDPKIKGYRRTLLGVGAIGALILITHWVK